jgi:hypothetical protein
VASPAVLAVQSLLLPLPLLQSNLTALLLLQPSRLVCRVLLQPLLRRRLLLLLLLVVVGRMLQLP